MYYAQSRHETWQEISQSESELLAILHIVCMPSGLYIVKHIRRM